MAASCALSGRRRGRRAASSTRVRPPRPRLPRSFCSLRVSGAQARADAHQAQHLIVGQVGDDGLGAVGQLRRGQRGRSGIDGHALRGQRTIGGGHDQPAIVEPKAGARGGRIAGGFGARIGGCAGRVGQGDRVGGFDLAVDRGLVEIVERQDARRGGGIGGHLPDAGGGIAGAHLVGGEVRRGGDGLRGGVWGLGGGALLAGRRVV
ncbi:hypothetical protein [Roseovarius pacificus]|uniref:hypothetical protein n=1 Tax=Roseovarius pacificus TaxID=337701 RepID=UPI002A18D17E|nr:hypothetical protein [Roseovarius pacificus]